MLLKRLARTLGGCCAALLLLAVPVFAFRAVTPGAKDAGAAIAPADDAAADGLQIVDTPAAPTGAPRTQSADGAAVSAETILRNWTYTGHPNPSPGH
jgi:hypothetical protein